MDDLNKTILFTTNATPTIQYQTTEQIKQPKIEGQKPGHQQEFQTFCYTNVNMIQKLTPTSQANTSTINLAQLSEDNKTCFIAQPFGYGNYALVNQMQLAQNGVAMVDGRLQVVNKPIIANTVSNISFKCDVCGMIFTHLTLLNQHKRQHNQDGNDNANEGITVLTQSQAQNLVQAQGLVQAQNIVLENGQQLGQIQIVATEALVPATSQSMQQSSQSGSEVTISTTKTVHIDKNQKCITCGGSIAINPKRKGPKLIRCETCINNDNNATQITTNRAATQIFVAPDGDVKFELSEIPNTNSESSIDSLGHNIITTAQVTQQNNQQQIVEIKYPPGHHPVKKRNTAAVTKCQKCNGSGYVLIGGKKELQQQADKPFHCNICGGSFSRYSSLWSHKKLHSGEKNYKCPICGLAFAKAVYLKNHSRIHTGEKPYRCATCGMQFAQSPHLKNHERTHSGEKPYVCEVCDKGFARHATLWNHRRIHTGEKPYKCDICCSAFSQAAHLKNHAKVHSSEKPFKCDICSAAFSDRFALKRHRGIHEKYGQTAPRQPAQLPNPVQKEEAPEIEEDSKMAEHEVIISGL